MMAMMTARGIRNPERIGAFFAEADP